MTNKNLNNDEKQTELQKYRDLVLATLDYHIDRKEMQIKSADFDSIEHYEELKRQTEEHYNKGRLNRLKKWFRDLTEIYVEAGDLKFNKYLKDKTQYDTDIFKSFFLRIDKIIEKGKITSDNQFNDINIMVNQLCQTVPVDNNKIKILNRLISEYEQIKSRQIKKPTA